jgi:hypothetical protein
MTYQWQLDGVAIEGATQPTYRIETASDADAGAYTVTLTNDCGTVISAIATVFVHHAPVILTQPEGLLVGEGQSASFFVAATGEELTYQWRLNGVEILGATESTLLIDAASASDASIWSPFISRTATSRSNDCCSIARRAIRTLIQEARPAEVIATIARMSRTRDRIDTRDNTR